MAPRLLSTQTPVDCGFNNDFFNSMVAILNYVPLHFYYFFSIWVNITIQNDALCQNMNFLKNDLDHDTFPRSRSPLEGPNSPRIKPK